VRLQLLLNGGEEVGRVDDEENLGHADAELVLTLGREVEHEGLGRDHGIAVHVEDATIEGARGRGSSGGHLWGRREIE
jgi:hypothetical protein